MSKTPTSLQHSTCVVLNLSSSQVDVMLETSSFTAVPYKILTVSGD